MEEDYLAIQKNGVGANDHSPAAQAFKTRILPLIDQEINQGKHFAQFRQVYRAVILAQWFKKKMKDTILSRAYFNSNKTKGVEALDPAIREKIYNEYVAAFKQGVYNYVKTTSGDASLACGLNGKRSVPIFGSKITKRQYFSGGIVLEGTAIPETLPESAMPPRLAEQVMAPLTVAIRMFPTVEPSRLRPVVEGYPLHELTQTQKKELTDWLDHYQRRHFIVDDGNISDRVDSSSMVIGRHRFENAGLNGAIAKDQIEETGLDWNSISEKLIENGWARRINPAEVHLTANFDKEKDQMSKIFGDDFSKVLPILQQALNWEKVSGIFLDPANGFATTAEFDRKGKPINIRLTEHGLYHAENAMLKIFGPQIYWEKIYPLLSDTRRWVEVTRHSRITLEVSARDKIEKLIRARLRTMDFPPVAERHYRMASAVKERWVSWLKDYLLMVDFMMPVNQRTALAEDIIYLYEQNGGNKEDYEVYVTQLLEYYGVSYEARELIYAYLEVGLSQQSFWYYTQNDIDHAAEVDLTIQADIQSMTHTRGGLVDNPTYYILHELLLDISPAKISEVINHHYGDPHTYFGAAKEDMMSIAADLLPRIIRVRTKISHALPVYEEIVKKNRASSPPDLRELDHEFIRLTQLLMRLSNKGASKLRLVEVRKARMKVFSQLRAGNYASASSDYEADIARSRAADATNAVPKRIKGGYAGLVTAYPMAVARLRRLIAGRADNRDITRAQQRVNKLQLMLISDRIAMGTKRRLNLIIGNLQNARDFDTTRALAPSILLQIEALVNSGALDFDNPLDRKIFQLGLLLQQKLQGQELFDAMDGTLRLESINANKQLWGMHAAAIAAVAARYISDKYELMKAIWHFPSAVQGTGIAPYLKFKKFLMNGTLDSGDKVFDSVLPFEQASVAAADICTALGFGPSRQTAVAQPDGGLDLNRLSENIETLKNGNGVKINGEALAVQLKNITGLTPVVVAVTIPVSRRK